MSELYFPSLRPENQEGDGPTTTAELQGALCGLLCVDANASRTDWYQVLFEDFYPEAQEKQDLQTLFDETLQSLNSHDFDFSLALPDDRMPLPSRLAAMAEWCQGLVYGLGVAGLKDDSLSAEGQEYLADVIKIVQINTHDLEDSDDDEANFEELAEYLRMGLLMIFTELQPTEPDNSTEH